MEIMSVLDEPANCEYVRDFLSKHPEYEHIGSLDLFHIYEYNVKVILTLMQIARRKAVDIYVFSRQYHDLVSKTVKQEKKH